MTRIPELSCYTSNLFAYLKPKVPTIRRTVAESVRLAVRTDLPGGELAFSHHPRLDVDEQGHRLDYRSAPTWEHARAALLTELVTTGRVLGCCDTYHLPWSPSYGVMHAPHWVLLHRQVDGWWFVADHFASLTPLGHQEPYLGWLSDLQLRTALTPMGKVAAEVAHRDRHALGLPVELPPYSDYRWLEFAPASQVVPAERQQGEWLTDLVEALRHVAGACANDHGVVAKHVDDLWTASRHFRYRLTVEAEVGQRDSTSVKRASTAWEELPRALRFAAASAARGRQRNGVVTQAFTQLINTILESEAHRSQHNDQ